jgi:hypothetical protein
MLCSLKLAQKPAIMYCLSHCTVFCTPVITLTQLNPHIFLFQVKALFRKVGHALPGMDSAMADGSRDQSKLVGVTSSLCVIATSNKFYDLSVTRVDLNESSATKEEASTCACWDIPNPLPPKKNIGSITVINLYRFQENNECTIWYESLLTFFHKTL